MLTALIAKDELLVRMGIISSVPWSELDIAVVGEAGDGLEAWQLYQEYHPDIIVLDILMPGMNGVELLGRIRRVDQRCVVIVVTNVDKGDQLEKVRQLGVSDILHKMTIKRNDIHDAVRKACQALRPEQDDPSVEAGGRKAWEAFFFGNVPDSMSFEAQGMTAIRLFPGDRLTPALQRSLSALLLQRLGEPETYVHVCRDNCELLIWKDLSARNISERALMDFARCVQDNFHINPGVVTLFAQLDSARMPRMAQRLVTLLRDPQLFDHPVLSLDANGGYLNERLESLRSALAINLPVCSNRGEILALKMRLDRYPGELEGGFKRLLRSAAPLLESLNLPASQRGLSEMTRSICDATEERLEQASPKVRPEIRRAMAYIQAHLTENIQREQLGKLVNYDSVYFSKLFKAELGMSYTDYLILVRMLRAQELLCQTDIPISDIVAQCGYADFSYFSGRFRQLCGVTPHEWRENHREAIV